MTRIFRELHQKGDSSRIFCSESEGSLVCREFAGNLSGELRVFVGDMSGFFLLCREHIGDLSKILCEIVVNLKVICRKHVGDFGFIANISGIYPENDGNFLGTCRGFLGKIEIGRIAGGRGFPGKYRGFHEKYTPFHRPSAPQYLHIRVHPPETNFIDL